MKASPVAQTAPSRTSLSIAFADDVPEIRDLVQGWLTAEGHRVTCVANGRELAEICRKIHFDLVITDVMMPDSDGFEVIANLKTTQPETRVIAISGGGITMITKDCLRVAQRLGATAVLPKPFNRADFMAIVRQVSAPVVNH
jgi:CheY-like chemotaxis protein